LAPTFWVSTGVHLALVSWGNLLIQPLVQGVCFSLFTTENAKHHASGMPLESVVAENQPESGADPLKALRLKLKKFKNRLLTTQISDLSPLPNLAWREGDLNDLATLVHAVYMTKHEREGTTGGRELLWVDREYQSLRLFETIGNMIRAVPVRPVAAIQRELVKIDPDYNPAHLMLSPEKVAIALQNRDHRFRELVRLSAALGKPKNCITNVPVDEFKDVLRELCPDVLHKLEMGFELLKGERVERLISRTLFLDLQRQELVWRLLYWDQVEVMAGWILGLHDDRLTELLSGIATHLPETPEEFLVRRNRSATKRRVAKHRSKHSKASDYRA
jgi:hypothetical protein